MLEDKVSSSRISLTYVLNKPVEINKSGCILFCPGCICKYNYSNDRNGRTATSFFRHNIKIGIGLVRSLRVICEYTICQKYAS